MAARARSHDGAPTTRAFLLRRVEYGEADLVLTLFTEKLGRVSALARSARKSARRFGGALEPFYTLEVRLEERPKSELSLLREARIARPRQALEKDLERMKAAGRALGWVKSAAPAHTPEPELFSAVEALLDDLADPDCSPQLSLAASGLYILALLGWALDLERCVRCGKPCPAGSAARVDAAHGGLVCKSCGGARISLAGPLRERLGLAAANGDWRALEEGDAELALGLVEDVLRAHAGVH